MRFLFVGSGKIAENCLKAYFEGYSKNNVLVGIVGSAELIELGLNKNDSHNQLKTILIDKELRKEEEVINLLEETKPDFVISVQYPWIFSSNVLLASGFKILNLHNAKLPDYRGHNSISHEILNGESHHTSSLHWMEAEVDRGVLAKSVQIEIFPDDTAYSLWLRSLDASVELFISFLKDANEIVSTKKGTPIISGGKYYSKKGIENLKKISASASIDDVDKIARAFCFPPHEPAYFDFNNKKLYVLPHSYKYN